VSGKAFSCQGGGGYAAGKQCQDGIACTAAAAACNDANPCTTDSCGAGGCVHAAVGGPCDDGDTCTVDSCDGATGACTSAPSAGSCSDGNACTSGDSCAAGTCKAGAAKNCGDGNPCTDDLCSVVDGACSSVNKSGACDDGDACTVGDACQLGGCVAGPAKTCSDGDACTADGCAAATGLCTFVLSVLCQGPATALPYSQAFACSGASGWTMTGTANGPGWAIDATAAFGSFTGYHSSSCSANFNDGWDYDCPVSPKVSQVSGELTSRVFAGSAASAQTPLWVSAWMAGDFTSGSAVYLESTTDGASWTVLRSYDAYDLPMQSWRQFVEPLPALAGGNFKLRWRFQSAGCAGNSGPGAYVDDVKVYAAAPCSQDDPYGASFDGPYYPGFSMGSPPYVLDPPLYAGGAIGSAKASWHVNGSFGNKVAVQVEFSGGSGATVCVRHVCDGSGAACKVTCPAGTSATADKAGCCMTKTASGTIGFTPTGTAYGSGKTTVTVTPLAATCEKVLVKAVF